MAGKAKLFEYAAIYHPKETKDQQGNDTTPAAEIAVEHARTLAKSAEEVSIRVARAIPEKYLDRLDQVEILIRPFN